MATNFHVDVGAECDVPNVAVKSRGQEVIFIIPHPRWTEYLGEETIPIIVNYINHEDTHLTLNRLHEYQASHSLDHFGVPKSILQKANTQEEVDMALREMEIAEPTGLELLIDAVEHYEDRNKRSKRTYILHTEGH